MIFYSPFERIHPHENWFLIFLEEVTNIYAKCNMEFRDIVWLDNQNDEEHSKVLKHQK